MADIEVLANDGSIIVVATVNGQNDFDFDFLAYTGASVRATFKPGTVDEAPLELGVDYTVAGLSQENGGSITLIGAFAGVAVIDDEVLIYRSTPIERLFDYQVAGDFRAETVNRELDTMVMIDQEARRDIDRSFKAPLGSVGGEVIMGADGTAAVFSGGNIVEGPSVTEIENAEGYAERAEDALAEILISGGVGFDSKAQAENVYRPQVVPSRVVLNGYFLAGDTNQPLLFVPGAGGSPGVLNITLDDEVTVAPFELRSDTPTPQMFGFVADGATANNAELATADAYAQLLGKELVFPAGAYRISGNLTITSPVRLMPGAYFVVDAGSTLTLNGRVSLPFGYVFRGAGLVEFGFRTLSVARPEWWGAVADGLDASAPLNTTAIQRAMDVCRNVMLDASPNSGQRSPETGALITPSAKEYRTNATLAYKYDATIVAGAGRRNSTIYLISTTGPAFHNPNKNDLPVTVGGFTVTGTRYNCVLEGVKVMAPNLTSGIVVDWKSMQFGRIHDFWIVGKNLAGITALNLGAVWVSTECTYNNISEGYIGLCSTGIRFEDGANNNHIDQVRVQCSVAGGFAILLLGTGAGRISSNLISACGFEFPGQINTGLFASTGVDGLTLLANRWESLATAINVALAAEHVDIGPSQHYSSNTTKVTVPSTGVNGVIPFPAVRAYLNGSTVAIERGHGLTAFARKAGVPAGGYRISFPQPDNNYFAQASSNQRGTAITAQSSGYIEVETRDAAGALADAAILQIAIDTQRA